MMLVVADGLFPFPHCVVEVSVANRNGAVGEGKTRLIFCICAMHLFWRSQAQGRVRPAVVIQVYSLGGGPAGLRFGGKSGIQPILLFEDPVDSFRQRILGGDPAGEVISLRRNLAFRDTTAQRNCTR